MQIAAGGQGISPASIQETPSFIPEDQRERLWKQLLQAMKDSYVTIDGVEYKKEQGGWIVKNDEGTYDLVRIPRDEASATSKQNELWFSFPTKTSEIPKYAIGTLHTHTIPESTVLPSEKDIELSRILGLPGIIVGPNRNTMRIDLRTYDRNTRVVTPKLEKRKK